VEGQSNLDLVIEQFGNLKKAINFWPLAFSLVLPVARAKG
jgi:hypothetical protein